VPINQDWNCKFKTRTLFLISEHESWNGFPRMNGLPGSHIALIKPGSGKILDKHKS